MQTVVLYIRIPEVQLEMAVRSLLEQCLQELGAFQPWLCTSWQLVTCFHSCTTYE